MHIKQSQFDILISEQTFRWNANANCTHMSETSLKYFLCMHLAFSVAFESIYSMSSSCDAVVSYILWEKRKIKTNRTLNWAEWKVARSHRKYRENRRIYHSFPDTISKVLFSYSFSFSHWLFSNLNFIIHHSAVVCPVCVCVCGCASKLKLVSRFSSMAFLPQMLILFAQLT